MKSTSLAWPSTSVEFLVPSMRSRGNSLEYLLNKYSHTACKCAKSLQSSPTLGAYGLYVAHQTPLSLGFSRQEYWSGLLCPPPGDLPDPGIEPVPLKSPGLAGRFFTTSTIWEAHHHTESSPNPHLSSAEIRPVLQMRKLRPQSHKAGNQEAQDKNLCLWDDRHSLQRHSSLCLSLLRSTGPISAHRWRMVVPPTKGRPACVSGQGAPS